MNAGHWLFTGFAICALTSAVAKTQSLSMDVREISTDAPVSSGSCPIWWWWLYDPGPLTGGKKIEIELHNLSRASASAWLEIHFVDGSWNEIGKQQRKFDMTNLLTAKIIVPGSSAAGSTDWFVFGRIDGPGGEIFAVRSSDRAMEERMARAIRDGKMR